MTEIQLLQEIRDLLESRAPAPEVMDIPQLSAYLGISVSKIYQMKAQKKIPCSMIDGCVRFRKKAIDSWLEDLDIADPKNELKLQDGRRSENRAA